MLAFITLPFFISLPSPSPIFWVLENYVRKFSSKNKNLEPKPSFWKNLGTKLKFGEATIFSVRKLQLSDHLLFNPQCYWAHWLMLHSVVVVNTISTSFRVGNSAQFTFRPVFTTWKLVAFNSMMIIPTSWPWPL